MNHYIRSHQLGVNVARNHKKFQDMYTLERSKFCLCSFTTFDESQRQIYKLFLILPPFPFHSLDKPKDRKRKRKEKRNSFFKQQIMRINGALKTALSSSTGASHTTIVKAYGLEKKIKNQRWCPPT